MSDLDRKAIRLTVHESPEEIEGLSSGWDALIDRSPDGSLPMTSDWAFAWWKAYGARRRLTVLALWAEDGLVGLAPLTSSRESPASLALLGDGTDESEPLDLPVFPQYMANLRDALGVLLAPAGEWTACRLNVLPAESWVAAGPLRVHGWLSVRYRSPASSIDLPGSWAGYLGRLGSADRQHLIRYTRRLERRYEVRVERCECPQELAGYLEDLFRLHQLRWTGRGQAGSFAVESRKRFYRELAPRLLGKGRLQLWRLRLGGRPAAVQFAYAFRGTVSQLQEGFDPRFRSDRVGTVLRAHVLRSVIEAGFRRYDYLGGFDREKARWGASPYWYYHVHLARYWTWAALRLLLGDLGHRLRHRFRPPGLSLPGTLFPA